MKLDPRSIPYRGLRLGVQWAVGVATLGLIAGSMIDLRLGTAVAGLGIAAAGFAGAAWAAVYHRRFEFQLTPDSLDITSGVFARRTREIPLDRIQNVDIRQGVVPRMLGIAELRFETAGGRGTEARLQYLDQRLARELQERIDRHGEAAEPRSEAADSRDETPVADRTAGEMLYSIKPIELGLLSITSIDWRAIGFVVLAGVGVIPDGPPTDFSANPIAPLAAIAQPIFLTAAAVVGNAALLTARFFKFRLWRAGETLRYERGLLRRFSGSIPLDRVHLLRLRDNPITRALGFAALDIQTAGYGPESEGGSQSAVPIAERERVLELADSVEPWPELELQRPPRRARRRYAIRFALLAVLVTGGLFAVDQFVRSIPWYLGGTLLVLAPVAAHLAWRHRGYALGEQALLVRAGFWRRTTYLVPFYRVQTVGTTATIFQRRWSLATVRIDTASGAPAAHDLDVETARDLREAVADDLMVDRLRRQRDPGPSGTPTVA